MVTAIFLRCADKKCLRVRYGELTNRSREWLARGDFFSFQDYIRRWLIDLRWCSLRNSGDDVKFSPSEWVRSLARCESCLRRHRSAIQKRRRFMLPRTLPAMIIGAFILATLPSGRSSPCPFRRSSSSLRLFLSHRYSASTSKYEILLWQRENFLDIFCGNYC